MPDESMAEQVDLMEQVWSSLDELLADLTPEDWTTATECPGWSVKDQVAHMAGNETLILGRPQPSVELPAYDHIKNELGNANEIQVEARRPWPPETVVAEWREVTGERLLLMRGYEGDDWDGTSATPVGELRRRDGLRLRIVDAWTHEQDIRRAVGKPGHLNGAVARFCFETYKQAMPIVVVKRAGATDGTSVFFDVSGMAAEPFAVVVEQGWGRFDRPPASPTVTLRMDLETFCCLAAGRWTGAGVLGDGRVKVSGDEDLARRILDNMVAMP